MLSIIDSCLQHASFQISREHNHATCSREGKRESGVPRDTESGGGVGGKGVSLALAMRLAVGHAFWPLKPAVCGTKGGGPGGWRPVATCSAAAVLDLPRRAAPRPGPVLVRPEGGEHTRSLPPHLHHMT